MVTGEWRMSGPEMRMISVRGFKKTGKTTTCTKIIEELVRRGYSVGSCKDTHFEGFAMDHENTDSWKHARAGASTVIVTAPGETDILIYGRVSLEKLMGLYHEDWLVIEGDAGVTCPNIVTGKAPEDLQRRRDANTICFSGLISGTLQEYDGLPVWNAVTDIAPLVDWIEQNTKTEKGYSK